MLRVAPVNSGGEAAQGARGGKEKQNGNAKGADKPRIGRQDGLLWDREAAGA